ncbi:phage tail assembly chaperone [Pseudomonas sp. NBRC 111126]|uniref:phage tail assembly chaperone n=1 Tax=Pseudomonas sp. NBRC 111126 TaxID=1661041 RepID=UPI00086364CA|nr:phage tail assembly chaperone [Pseudomonas sp. NBRC 111126]
MARAKAAGAQSLRAMALDPIRNFKHEPLDVPEWDGAKVVVMALSAGDWAEYRRRAAAVVAAARAAVGLSEQPKEGGDEDQVARLVDIDSSSLYAFVLARTLLDESHARIFEDEDVPAVAKVFSPVHDRLVGKAFELSGVEAGAGAQDPVEAAGNG